MNQKKVGMVILISKKVNFRAKNITREKEVHYPILKGLIHKEDITILSVSAHNSKALKYMKHLPYRNGDRTRGSN